MEPSVSTRPKARVAIIQLINSAAPQSVLALDHTTVAPSDLEAGAAASSASDKKQLDWRNVLVAFCFGGGLGISLASVEVRRESPISFSVMSVLIALTFSFAFVSTFIPANHMVAAGVLEFAGVLLAAAVLFTALCIPLPMAAQCVVWLIFACTVVGVFIWNVISSSSP